MNYIFSIVANIILILFFLKSKFNNNNLKKYNINIYSYTNDTNCVKLLNNKYNLIYLIIDKKKIIIENKLNKNNNKIIIENVINLFNNIKDLKYNIFHKEEKKIKSILSKYCEFLSKFKENDRKNYFKLLINSFLKRNKTQNKYIIEISLDVDNILNKKEENLIKFILKVSLKYNIDYLLILSIIKAESNFNIYSISDSGAIGLMQITHDKSVIDVLNFLNKKKNININNLINYKKNIKIGIIYIYILKKYYLKNIKDYNVLRYLIISSYNGGINRILKTFSNNIKKSIDIINNSNPKDVYDFICNNNPILEISNYLKTVNEAYTKYKKIKNIKDIENYRKLI